MDSARYHAFRIVFEFETFNLQLKSIRNAYYKKNNIASNDRKRAMVLSNEVIRWKKYLDALIAPSLNKSIKILPLEILLKPAIDLNNVVLPQPEGPSKVKNSPALILTFILFSATKSSN